MINELADVACHHLKNILYSLEMFPVNVFSSCQLTTVLETD